MRLQRSRVKDALLSDGSVDPEGKKNKDIRHPSTLPNERRVEGL
nr:MAG TPA: hypothetical protein [Caudoviricetes sp.]